MTPQAFREAVSAALFACLPPAQQTTVPINWAKGPRDFAAVRLLLSIVSQREEYQHDATADDPTIQSAEIIVVQVVAESQHDDPTENPQWILEKIRLPLRRQAILAGLRAAGVVLVDLPLASRDVSYTASGRTVSAYVMELTFRAVFSDTDAEFDLIEHVEAQGTMTAPGPDVFTVDAAADKP